jgi:hypothetical protein
MYGGGNWTPPNTGALSETLGFSAGTTVGVTLTSGAANTKGSYVDVGGVTSFTYNRLCVQFITPSAAADFVVDLAVNASGNRFIIAEDLRYSTARRFVSEGTQVYELPLTIKGGAQLSARCASATASATMQIVMQGFSNGVAGMPGLSRCRALYTPATSRGVAIDPGGTANTKGAYSQLVASSGFNAELLMMAIGFNDDIARAAAARFSQDLAIGAGGAEQIFNPDYFFCCGTTTDGPFMSGGMLLPFYIPAGSRISARGQSSSIVAGDCTWDLALWGFER